MTRASRRWTRRASTSRSCRSLAPTSIGAAPRSVTRRRASPMTTWRAPRRPIPAASAGWRRCRGNIPSSRVAELKRSCDQGAVGVMVLANIDGRSLTDPLFAPVWQEIDRRALPVLVHPTAPPGTPEMDLRAYNLIASIGFMFDTSLAVARMMFDGFFDRFPNLKLIASHAGAALPYLVGRLDICFENMNACRTRTQTPPRDYLRHIYYDSVDVSPRGAGDVHRCRRRRSCHVRLRLSAQYRRHERLPRPRRRPAGGATRSRARRQRAAYLPSLNTAGHAGRKLPHISRHRSRDAARICHAAAHRRPRSPR